MKHFCLMCGTQLESKIIEDRAREICPDCGWIHYKQYKVSAGVRIERDGCLLLVQRGIQPWRGNWYMPAGFLEINEEPEDAAVREAFEETGLHVKTHGLAGVYTYNDDPRGNGILFLYDAEIIGGNMQESDETLQIAFLSPDEIIGLEFTGNCGRHQISDWLKTKGIEMDVNHV
jgi:ADP-ribose pyrophosphatase YjhB (NUDIX family)